MTNLLAALFAFVSSGVKPSTEEARQLVAVLLFKVFVILVFLGFFFGPGRRPEIDDQAVAKRLTSNSQAMGNNVHDGI